ncbi:MAG TPA: MFS transporter [Jatrophihabitantaceae bacterium]|nr:MFS transporter [Jatrophihabitantaceae bacterium]
MDRSTPGALRHLRFLVTAFFVLDGFVFASWVVRVPDIKAQVGASASSLGLALLGVSAGAVVTMIVTGRLCRRFGSERMSVAMGVLLSLTITLPALTRSVAVLTASLFAFGVGFGGLNVAMNSVAVDLTARIARPIMPSFHAAYSLGGLLGAVAGGLVAEALSPAWHLTLVGALGLVVTLRIGVALLRNAEPRRSASTAAAAPVRPRRGTRSLVLLFGVIAMCTAYGEGALADWAALHLRSDLHTSAGLAAAGYASFSVAMLAGRLSGTWTLARLGRTRVLAAGGLTAAGGMLLAALAPVLALAVIGFVLVGLGLANVFPAAIGEAGALAGSQGVAVASTIGYTGFLAGPPIIGFLADRFSLPIALTTIAGFAAAAGAIALVARHAEARMPVP